MNKVLICVFVPTIEQSYELFVPINRKIGLIKKMVAKSIIDMTNNEYQINSELKLINKSTNYVYKDDEYIINTDIRNGAKLILL